MTDFALAAGAAASAARARRPSAASKSARASEPSAPAVRPRKARRFLDDQPPRYAGRADAVERSWADLCQMILASNAFLYIE